MLVIDKIPVSFLKKIVKHVLLVWLSWLKEKINSNTQPRGNSRIDVSRICSWEVLMQYSIRNTKVMEVSRVSNGASRVSVLGWNIDYRKHAVMKCYTICYRSLDVTSGRSISVAVFRLSSDSNIDLITYVPRLSFSTFSRRGANFRSRNEWTWNERDRTSPADIWIN